MYNQYTDRYKFIEVEVIKALPLWGRNIPAKEDFSLLLFRNKEYVYSLPPYEKKSGSKPRLMRAYNGDAVYKIDMRPRAVPFVGSFETKDNYVRIYNFTLVLKVIDPEIFARRYSVGLDPVFLAMDTVREALVEFGEEHQHDQLSKLKQPDLDWNKGLVEETGAQIHQITKWILHEDMKRLETAEIEQETIKEKLRLRREAETGLIKERTAREYAALQHMYLLHRQLSSTAAVELKAILQERIRDAFESGQPIDKVAKETLDLLNALYKGIENFSFSSGLNKNGNFTDEYITSSFSNGDQAEINTEEMPSINELIRQSFDGTVY